MKIFTRTFLNVSSLTRFSFCYFVYIKSHTQGTVIDLIIPVWSTTQRIAKDIIIINLSLIREYVGSKPCLKYTYVLEKNL
jgi:hypothetical protein